MLKLTLGVLAVALAGTASAAGWRDLRVDASSEAAYERSLALFNEQLSPERQSVLTAALMDIWLEGTARAGADQGQYTVGDYYRQIHGLSYEELVTFTDPTGKTAKEREREAKRAQLAGSAPAFSPWQAPYHANQEERVERAHQTIDSQSSIRTRQAGTVERTRM